MNTFFLRDTQSKITFSSCQPICQPIFLIFFFHFILEAFQQVRRQFFSDDTQEPAVGLMCLDDMEMIGHLFVASLVHDGPGPSFLSPWIYDYIVGGFDTVSLPKELKNPIYQQVRM